MASVTKIIHAGILRLRPQLEQFVAMGAERANLAWGIARAGGLTLNEREGLRDLGSAHRGGLSMLIEAALRAAGIGAPGPTGEVVVPPPPTYAARDGQNKQWHAPDADHVALARAEFDSSETRLMASLSRAIDAATKARA